jgi:hypothetical protein
MDARILTVGILGALVATAGVANADDGIPSYARPDEVIHGVVSSVDGTTVYVHDDRGFTDRVQLRDGTIINPTGLTISRGQTVTIHGVPNGPAFDATQIDTPYSKTYAFAAPAYGPVYRPYPYYPYAYGYYPGYYGPIYNFGIGFRFH